MPSDRIVQTSEKGKTVRKKRWLYIIILMGIAVVACAGLSVFLQETTGERWPALIPIAAGIVSVAILTVKRDEIRG